MLENFTCDKIESRCFFWTKIGSNFFTCYIFFFFKVFNITSYFFSLGQLSVGDDSSSSGDTSSSSSQSAQSPQQQQQQQPSSNPPATANSGHSTSPEQQRRSFYLRLSQRAVSRSEITQYELVHVLGLLRVPQRPNRGPSTHSRTRSRSRGICCCYWCRYC
jgi:hypothetical protein